ncbi:MAG: peptidoglycan-binding protein [Hasllibacter sp.]
MKSIGTRLLAAAILAAAPVAAAAQQAGEWVQLQALRSQAEAEAGARDLAARGLDVSGFRAAGGWWVLTLGPFPDAAGARAALDAARGRVPADAYVADGDAYRQRFWPAAEAAARQGGTGIGAAEGGAAAALAPGDAIEAPAPPAGAPDETPAEARASEGQLDRAARQDLQRALEWAGFYGAAIDGAFGRGTRAAMRDWQTDRGFEPTGILTTAQRAQLIAEWNAVFDGLGMRRIVDVGAGLALEMPMGAVRFDGYETPFARYEPAGPEGIRVLLIAQAGDRATLGGLYEIMQTLAIVPEGGPRELAGDAFTLEGTGGGIASRTYARHEDGRVKGLTLVWPAGDPRLDRVWERMRASLIEISDAVLDESLATPAEEQDVDLLAGLEIRRADRTGSGVFVDGRGAVLTAGAVVEGCRRVLIDDVHEAGVEWAEGGAALLRPVRPLAPPAVAAFRDAPPRIGEEVAVAGFPFGGALGRATLTFGTLADIRGLAGEPERDRYEMAAAEGDAGGPVLDGAGRVAGLLLPREGGDRRLPRDVALGLDGAALAELLRARAVPARAGSGGDALGPLRLARAAAEIAAQVACYE